MKKTKTKLKKIVLENGKSVFMNRQQRKAYAIKRLILKPNTSYNRAKELINYSSKHKGLKESP